MKSSTIRNWLTAILGMAIAAPSLAVHLDPGGRGQVLLYPYYTVNKGQQTMLSVVNTSSAAQAVKVRITEGYNGRDVLDFNLFLSPFDSWSGTIFALRDAGINSDGAAILSRDTSCTAPLFAEDQTSINGTPYVAFREFSYLTPSDGGPTTIDRTREGMIEIIAMSNLAAPLDGYIAHGSSGTPPTGCAQVRNLQGTDAGLSTPAGGLIGTVSIINGGQGTFLSTRAEALAGFTGVSLFTFTGSITPNLSNVNDGPAGALGSQATAHIFDGSGKAHDLTYPVREPDSQSRRIDAVSAVLMADNVYNEFQRAPSLGAASEWVMTFPTKRYYTDPLNSGFADAVQPFTRVYNGSPTTSQRFSKTAFDPAYYSADARRYSPVCQTPCCFSNYCPPPPPPPFLAFVTNVLPITQSYSAITESAILGSRLLSVGSTNSSHYQGTIEVNLDPPRERHRLTPSREGKVLTGLPVIGYWASNIVNSNAIDGVLANYAAAVRHAKSMTCVKASDGTPCD